MAEELLSAGGERTLPSIAGTLRSIANDLERGDAIRLETDERTTSVALAEPVTFELEVERETNGASTIELEVELEWAEPADDAAELEEGGEEPAETPVEAAESGAQADAPNASTDQKVETPADAEDADGDDGPEASDEAQPAERQPGEDDSLGQFQLFTDRAGEWRWRLVHRNGNVIAASGEGYTTKRNAEKGMRSVMRNAPGADVVDVDSS